MRLGANKLPKLIGRCPQVELDYAVVPAAYIPIRNERTVPVKLALSASGTDDVELAVYARGTAPTAAERTSCLADASARDGFVGARAITIPAATTYLLYIQAPAPAVTGDVVVKAQLAP